MINPIYVLIGFSILQTIAMIVVIQLILRMKAIVRHNHELDDHKQFNGEE